MCGIVGMVTAYCTGFDTDELDAFESMLLIDTLRGFDSTGAFLVENNGNVRGAKGAVNGGQFLRAKEWSDIRWEATRSGGFLVGHNRWATRGSITDKNAHPFVVDDKIVLVQNGTHKGSHRHLKDVDVDTEAVAHVIAEEPDIEKALQKVDAAYALVWYDVVNRTLNMIRNDERPLYLAYPKIGGAIFASEKEMILFACSRHNIALNDEPFMIATNSLIQWDITNPKKNKHTWRENLNIKFDPVHRPTNTYSSDEHDWMAFRRRFLHESEDDNDTIVSFPHTQRPTANSSAFNSPDYEKDPKAVLITTTDVVTRDDYKAYRSTSDEAKQVQNYFLSMPQQHEYLVEVVDYVPANNLPDCKSFHIICSSVDADDTGEATKALFIRLLYNVTKQDIEDVMKNPIYLVKIGSPVEHSVRGMNSDAADRIVTVHCHTYRKVNTHATPQ